MHNSFSSGVSQTLLLGMTQVQSAGEGPASSRSSLWAPSVLAVAEFYLKGGGKTAVGSGRFDGNRYHQNDLPAAVGPALDSRTPASFKVTLVFSGQISVLHVESAFCSMSSPLIPMVIPHR